MKFTKSVSANTGYIAMSEKIQKIESQGLPKNLEKIEYLLPELEKQFELCMLDIENHLKPEQRSFKKCVRMTR
ncbi:hypothetical protein [Desulfonatronovibrio magnus]|uniref:hypothetical protein n=1 Tax=Desulfonatronovibrio magnus TaxID=698827 RepID=UPI0005EAF6A5|nr:hypothetical protein [Desulfonatronovibrio magnus]RQD62530.1 MAG: hypothetical protein D5R98_05930 [Desulfonatronovibrio sp. MSAO_Bac4]